MFLITLFSPSQKKSSYAIHPFLVVINMSVCPGTSTLDSRYSLCTGKSSRVVACSNLSTIGVSTIVMLMTSNDLDIADKQQ